MPVIHNKLITDLIKDAYSPQDIHNVFHLLNQHGTFTFPALHDGLFSACYCDSTNLYTGYSNVWIRDNVYIALAHYLNGKTEAAVKTIKVLANYFSKHKWRFKRIIDGELDFNNPMNRPHVRFNGDDLSEIPEKWAHAQNDSLGYFLWLFCKIHNEIDIKITDEERELLWLFTLYFQTIHYWEDEDSGHWEEIRKVEASSIGVVVGGLTELKNLLEKERLSHSQSSAFVISEDLLSNLIDKGLFSLGTILPSECIQPDPNKNRRYDAALLFLIFPINLVSETMADRILYGIRNNLQGTYGIRRYLGDSFWAADYKDKLKPEERTTDFSDNMASRNQLLKEGEEAQWCIFDPIISIIYGLRYKKYHEQRYLSLQSFYFNRSLGQLTGKNIDVPPLKCPELYYLEKGQYKPNDMVPLLWAQANLWMAFKYMLSSLNPTHGAELLA